MKCEAGDWDGTTHTMSACHREAEYITGDAELGYDLRCPYHLYSWAQWTWIKSEPGQKMLADAVAIEFTDRATIPF